MESFYKGQTQSSLCLLNANVESTQCLAIFGAIEKNRQRDIEKKCIFSFSKRALTTNIESTSDEMSHVMHACTGMKASCDEFFHQRQTQIAN